MVAGVLVGTAVPGVPVVVGVVVPVAADVAVALGSGVGVRVNKPFVGVADGVKSTVGEANGSSVGVLVTSGVSMTTVTGMGVFVGVGMD